MKYQIKGDTDCPLVEISMDAKECIKIERGCMAYMQDVVLEGKMNTNKKGLGGLVSALGRSLTSGESFFITEATASTDDAILGIAPAIPGKVMPLKVGSQQYCLNTGVFLACDQSVSYVMKRQELGKAIFSNTGGLFIMETQGEGDLLVSCFGDIIPIMVEPNKPISIDNEHVVAWDSSLQYHIKIASGIFGFTSGEGLVNEFRGSGVVYIQTRNIRNLASAVQPFLPTSST